MLLDDDIKNQLMPYLDYIQNQVVLKVCVDKNDKHNQVLEFVQEVAALSDKISVQDASLERQGSFAIDSDTKISGIVFCGVPLGHEFGSFVMALVQVGGRKPKLDDKVIAQIVGIRDKLEFVTYMSLSCHNCPDVIQALNMLCVLNDNITHTVVDGGSFVQEVQAKEIMAVPAVFLNGAEWHNGRITITEILQKLGSVQTKFSDQPYDILVVGGGPAGVSASIYAARKGIRVGLLTQNQGGQMLDTLSIENIIGTKSIEGRQYAQAMYDHLKEYPIDIMTGQYATSLKKSEFLELGIASGATLKAKSVVISTGAKWRELGIDGEQEFKNKGIAYCPHCDGPLFAGKDIAVIGGGNSGVEAALDLSVIAKSITLIERGDQLKADKVLQERLKTKKNINIVTNAQTTKISGTTKVNGIQYLDTVKNKITNLQVEGVFILVGLVPNTNFIKEVLSTNPRGEIVVDKFGTTSMQGVYAAGDCTDSAYNQIIISLGSGAIAALSAYNYSQQN